MSPEVRMPPKSREMSSLLICARVIETVLSDGLRDSGTAFYRLSVRKGVSLPGVVRTHYSHMGQVGQPEQPHIEIPYQGHPPSHSMPIWPIRRDSSIAWATCAEIAVPFHRQNPPLQKDDLRTCTSAIP